MKRYEIEALVYHSEEFGDWNRCGDDEPGAEFELIEYRDESDSIGECLNTFSTRAEAESVKRKLIAEAEAA